jgi:hypothetical protein
VLQYPDETQLRNVPVTLVFRRSPFDEPTAARLRAHAEEAGFSWLHDPLLAVPGRVSEIARAADPLAEARRSEDYELAAPTDDKPFFFFRPRPFLAGIVERPARLFSDGQYLVGEVMALAVLLGCLSILLPLWRHGRVALRADPRTAIVRVAYFVCLGLGFMLVEMSLMQRFVLYLGHPTHALTAVVAGLLIGAGVGSAVAGRLGGRGRPALAAFAAVLVLLASDTLQPMLFSGTQQAPFAAKLALTLALVLPLGGALGTLMPLGIAMLPAGLVPWAWGVNGFASVVGACAAVLASMNLGFALTFRLGALCYGLAALVAFAAEVYHPRP